MELNIKELQAAALLRMDELDAQYPGIVFNAEMVLKTVNSRTAKFWHPILVTAVSDDGRTVKAHAFGDSLEEAISAVCKKLSSPNP